MSLFLATFVVPKLWMLISFSNQVYFEKTRKISYSPKKYLSNGVQHTPIRPHLAPAFKGFMVGSQISNLTPTPSFDHNLCKSSLNEQYQSTLNIHVSRPFEWHLGGAIWSFFAFSTKALNIRNSLMNATPKVGVHLGVIGLHPLHSPSFVRLCFTTKHILNFMGPCISHFVTNLVLGLRQKCFLVHGGHSKLSLSIY